MERLKAKEAEAFAAVRAIEEICEETGVPFYTGVSPLGQVYQPNSFQEKWAPLLDKTVEVVSKYGNYKTSLFDQLTDGNGSGEYEGWQHSSVC